MLNCPTGNTAPVDQLSLVLTVYPVSEYPVRDPVSPNKTIAPLGNPGAFCQEGAEAPLEVSTCPAFPAAVRVAAVPATRAESAKRLLHEVGAVPSFDRGVSPWPPSIEMPRK